MKGSRAILVTGASAVILAGGFVAAPDPAADGEDRASDGTQSDAAGPDAAGPDVVGPSGEATPGDEATGGLSGDQDGTGDGGEGSEGADAAVSGTFDGPVVSNIRGDYQVRLTFDAGALVAVEYPVAGTEASESRRVNDQALPVLEERFLEAQDWDVEHVTGASYTSPAMIESAQGAFEDAGL